MRQIAVINDNGIFKAFSGISKSVSNIPKANERVNMLLPTKNNPIIAPSGIRIMSDTQVPGGSVSLNDGSYGNEYSGNTQQVLGQLQSPTNFGKEITIVAEYWLSKNVRETTENNGIYIAQFQKDYYGQPQAQPWCAVFTWYVINEAAKITNCQHNYPGGSKIWGSTVKTLNESKKYYNVNTIPIPGSVMFRHSNGPFNHMGVTIFTKSNKLYTIEGNVKLKDGGEGIGLWEYEYSEIAKYGMQFIHTESNVCEPKRIISYHGYIPIQDDTGTKGITAEKGGNDNKSGNQSGNESGNESGNQGNDNKDSGNDNENESVWDKIAKAAGEYDEIIHNQDKFDNADETKKQKVCDYLIKLMIPPKEAVPHYSIMKNTVVGDDIFKSNVSGKSNAEIQGSALNYYKSSEDIGNNTEFGIFQDKAGNMIYVGRQQSQKFQALVMQGLLGPYDKNTPPDNYTGDNLYSFLVHNYNTFVIYESPNEKLNPPSNTMFVRGKRNLSLFPGRSDYDRFYRNKSPNEIKYLSLHPDRGDWIKNDSVTATHTYLGVEQPYNRTTWSVNLQGLLKYIEDYSLKNSKNGKTPFTKPFVILFKTPKPPTPQWEQLLNFALSTTSIMASGIVKIPGLSNEVLNNFKNVLGTIKKISLGQGFNFTDAVSLANGIGSIAKYVAPEFVTGINNEYIKPAQNSISKLIKSTKDWTSASNYIGIDSYKLQKIYNAYVKNSVTYLSELFTDISDDFNDVMKKVQNFANMTLINQINNWTSEGNETLKREIQKFGSISGTPILQELFIVGQSQTILPAIPNIRGLAGSILSNKGTFGEILSSGKSNEIRAGLIKSAFGYIPDSSIFDEITLNSLISKAVSSNDSKFILPPSINKDKQICYSYEIGKNTGKEIIPTCDDGYKYDPKLRRCVSNQTVVTKDLHKIPTVPRTPKIPTVPGTPTIPIVPGTPKIPTVPGTPTIPIVPRTPKIPTVPGTTTIPIVPGTPKIPTMPGTPTIPTVPGTPTTPTMPGTPTIPINPNLKPCEDTLRKKESIILKYMQDLKLASDKVKSCEQLSNSDRQKIIQYESQIKYLNEQLKLKGNNNCNSYVIELQNLRAKVKEYENMLRQKSDGINTTGQDSQKDAEINNLKKQLKDYQNKFNEYDKALEKHDKEELITPCIHKLSGKYFFEHKGAYLQAKQKDGYWLALYENYWVLIKNCELQIISKTPKTPSEPIPPPPVVPREPSVPTVPGKPVIPTSPGDCPGCPKLEVTKRIYEYPKCDEHCCDDFY